MSDAAVRPLAGRHRRGEQVFTSAHGLYVDADLVALITAQRRRAFQVQTPSAPHTLTFTLLRDAKRYALAHADELREAWVNAGKPDLFTPRQIELLPPGKSG
ncbi:hypothetical protein [Deinococcus kurensis]|uniref:hypothetical protein n=1 Tax=Deinococcus kurensis TaxID=2662757 RepID=UPI0012D2C69A|nr:hypothetical protein [Deinococcus kurensis]